VDFVGLSVSHLVRLHHWFELE